MSQSVFLKSVRRKTQGVFRLSLWFFCLLGTTALAQTPVAKSPEGQLIARVVEQNLGTTPTWTKTLFYASNMFGMRRSIIDSKTYFLAPDGAANPQAELIATIHALFTPLQPGADQNQHPRCRYPRRESWLIEYAGLDSKDLPQVDCVNYRDWLNGRHFEGLSLVFSSSYPNNPSSLFGHTFLRLHRSQKEQNSKLLDDAINFSAFPDTDNPLLYTLKGTMGGFPGYFSFTPYYLKVQEYSNADSRDLWEYRLNFSEHDINNMIRMVWEMGPHNIDYYYFDENCSAIILHFLEASKPQLDLTHLQIWVIPSDTVRAVAQVSGMVKEIKYRPSALTRFLAKYRPLPVAQQELLEEIADQNKATSALTKVAAFPDAEQAALVDAIIEYIDFYERLAGSNEVQTFGALRIALLQKRTNLPILPSKPVEMPQDEQPDLGHDSARLGVEAGAMANKDHSNVGFAQYHWRPALHDKLSSDRGYAAGLGIDFFDFYARHRVKDNKLEISSFYPLRITSLPSMEPIVKRPAWNLGIGTDLDYSCGFGGETDAVPCRTYSVKGGAGISIPAKSLGLLAYSMVSLSLGHHSQYAGGIYAEPTFETGLLWTIVDGMRVHFLWSSRAAFSHERSPATHHMGALQTAFRLHKNHELRFSGFGYTSGYREGLASYYFYL